MCNYNHWKRHRGLKKQELFLYIYISHVKKEEY